jgi:WD40 repeat protein
MRHRDHCLKTFVILRLLLLALLLPHWPVQIVKAETVPFLQLETGGHLATIKALVFTPDGHFLISAGEDKVIRIWSTLSGKPVRRVSGEMGPGKQGQIYVLAVSPDGKWLAAGGWFSSDDAAVPCCGDVRLYDFESGQLVAVLKGHTNAVFALGFSADSRRLVSAGADRIPIIWDIATKSAVAHLDKHMHKDRITAASFVGDNTVVTGSNDGSVRVWNASIGDLALPPLEYGARVSGFAITPDRRELFAGYFDGAIQSFDLARGQLIKKWMQAPGGVAAWHSRPTARAS